MIRRVLSVLLVFAGLTAPVFAATRAILLAEADVDVFEDIPDRTDPIQDILSAGIGRGNREGRLISYVRFDLGSLPSSSLVENVSIESGQLRLFAQSYGLAESKRRFFVTVSFCDDNKWSETTMTWNSRACINERKGEDSIVVQGTELPGLCVGCNAEHS